jgi:hypothetical protein
METLNFFNTKRKISIFFTDEQTVHDTDYVRSYIADFSKQLFGTSHTRLITLKDELWEAHEKFYI